MTRKLKRIREMKSNNDPEKRGDLRHACWATTTQMAIGEQVDENTHKTDHFPGSDKISNNHIDG